MEASMFCGACGQLTQPKSFTKRSFFVELLLWIAGLLPGLIYSLWRISSRYKGCRHCQSPNLLPPGTPMAQMIRQQLEASQQATK